MANFYSPTTKGFYSDVFLPRHQAAGTWPEDAIELTENQYQQLLDGINAGSDIVDVNGVLSLIEPSEEAQLEQYRLSALARISDSFALEVRSGVVCNVGGQNYTMDCDWDDPVQLKGGIDLVQSQGHETITLIDFYWQPHPGVSLTDALAVAEQMGSHYQSLLQQKAMLSAAIKTVSIETTLDAAKVTIDNIVWT
jgi:hypothetical protein